MSISDRLDEIRDRYVEWHQDRGDHTPAPNTETWADADHPDESMDHCIVRNDVPAMLAALRTVLDLHVQGVAYGVPVCMTCAQVKDADEWDDPDDDPIPSWTLYPCPTVRAISAALGEGA